MARGSLLRLIVAREVAALGGQAPTAPLALRTMMLPSVTVLGSSALLNVIVTVRPLTAVLVTIGAVTSARVNEIGPEPTRSLPSSETTTGPPAGLWTENV